MLKRSAVADALMLITTNGTKETQQIVLYRDKRYERSQTWTDMVCKERAQQKRCNSKTTKSVPHCKRSLEGKKDNNARTQTSGPAIQTHTKNNTQMHAYIEI